MRPEHFKRMGALPDEWPKKSLLRRIWESYTCPDCKKKALIHECSAYGVDYGGPYY